MRGSTHLTLELEEQGDGLGIFARALQRVGGHNLKRSGEMDGGHVGGSLQFSKGWKKPGITNEQVCGR